MVQHRFLRDRLSAMPRINAAAVAGGAVLGGVSATLAYGSMAKSSQFFGPSVYRGPGHRRSIALTFDDGPSEGTLPLIEYLAKEQVTCTFFQCGMNVRRLPRIAGEVAAHNHQLGNHTYSHPRLPFKSCDFIDEEFTKTQKIIQLETGFTPMLLRAPYGFRWFGMQAVQQKLALLGVMWTVIGNDWKWPAKRVVKHVLAHSSPGGIICLHDGRAVRPNPDVTATLSAVREIVPVLKDQGYRFEIVSDLLD
jgi:peptidoglycan-N-acetylglucosamine deacetylase